MAEILKRSVHTIRSLESGRLKLGQELATKMFHETGISPVWLLNGDPTTPPVAANGEPYTRAKFERAQAVRIHHDQPHPIFRNNDAVGFCARLIAILERAAERKDYYMAFYKINAALDSLRDEFGMDEKLYQHTGPLHVNISMGVDLLKKVLSRDKDLRSRIKKLHSPSKQPSKKRRG